jgi:hypothetical protein
MKRLSMSLPAIALAMVLALSGAAFTSTPATADKKIDKLPAYSSLHVPFVKESFQYDYYWFWFSDDSYNDQETLTMEEWEMGQYYYPGLEIDSNPMGGTQIMQGYLAPNQPHLGYPSIYLYVHYTH